MRLSEFSNKVTVRKRTYKESGLLIMPSNPIGVEIEVEGISKRWPGFHTQGTDMSLFWEAVEDNSLRNGAELRFRSSLFGEDLIRALDAVSDTLQECPYTTSVRTSTHVHYDVSLFKTTEDLLKFLAISGMFEKVLFQYLGGEREESIYCLPYSRSRGDFDALSTLAKNPGDYLELGRYQAINLQSIFKHGTVEFRHAGALTNKEDLLDWINIIGCLVRYASEVDFDLDSLSAVCSAKSPEQFLREVFPEYADKLMYPGVEDDIIDGARLVDDMIHKSTLAGLEVYRGLGQKKDLFSEIFKEQLVIHDDRPVFYVDEDVVDDNW